MGQSDLKRIEPLPVNPAAFIGLANATLIVACDTTTGTADIDSAFDDATVAAGKCIYMEFDAQPDSATTQASVKVTWTYD